MMSVKHNKAKGNNMRYECIRKKSDHNFRIVKIIVVYGRVNFFSNSILFFIIAVSTNPG